MLLDLGVQDKGGIVGNITDYIIIAFPNYSISWYDDSMEI